MNKEFPIYYKTWGNSQHPCIILIMGIGGQLIDWPSALTQGLAEQGFYVIAFDNRDTGLSHHYTELGPANFAAAIAAKQEGQPFMPPYTLENMAEDVIRLMDTLQIEKANIVGGSMGGIIAQYVALNFTQRVLSLTCIFSTSGDPSLPPPKPEVLQFFTASVSGEANSLEKIIQQKIELFKIYNHPDYADEAKIKAQVTHAFQRSYDPEGFKRLTLAMICAEPRTDRLKTLNVPCLIIHGDYNPAFSIEHGQQLANCIKGSHLEIIKDMGHGLPDYFAQKVADLMAAYFLS